MNSINAEEYLAPAREIAHEAGKLIMQYFTAGFETKHKQDKSPVTDADIAANRYIVTALSKLTPHIPIVAEEDEVLTTDRHECFWLVDPLDGTRSFVEGEPEFTVNLGLVQHGKPLIGVIYLPPADLMYFGGMGSGAYRAIGSGNAEIIRARKPANDGLVVVKSKSHPSLKAAAYLETINVKALIPGSSSIKFCKVAEGSADLYPRFGRTMEWDTAAGHAILNAAGGRVDTIDGVPLTYGKPRFENPNFIAYGL